MSEDKPKLTKDTIYVDVDDDITGIIDKVESAKQNVVALVLPKRAAVLQSIVNMRLLKRSADNADKNLVLVTTDGTILPLAGAAGLMVTDSLQAKPHLPSGPQIPKQPAAEPAGEKIPVNRAAKLTGDEGELPTKIDYGKSIGELAAAHEDEHPETIELGDDEDPLKAAAKSTEKLPKAPKSPKDKRLKVPNFDKFRLMLALGITGVIALIVFIYLAVAVLPKATIAIQTASTPVSTSLTLTTSDTAKGLDEAKGIIPAVLKTSDQTSSSQVNATGQQNNGTKATGSVTMSATECTLAAPDSVPSGTGIVANGLAFITQQTTKFSNTAVNNGGCLTYQAIAATPVTAQSGGSKYNVPSGTSFTVSGRSDITATGSASGGTDNIQTVVSQSDIDNAAASLKSSSSDSYSKNFINQLNAQGLYVLASTLNVGTPQTSASPAVGQPASNTTVSIKITYSVLTLKKDDLVKALTDALKQQIDPAKQQVQAADVLSGANISISGQSSPTVATLSINETAPAVPILNPADIKKQAEGKKSGDITNQISSVPGVKSVNVKMSPFWVSKAPKNPAKITVTLQHIAGNTGGQ